MSAVKILVTGANGQLGMELRELASGFPELRFIFLSREDLSIDDEEKVNHFFGEHQPDYCVNCAAYTAVDKAESEKEDAFRINALAAGILAKACRKFNTRFIHISTDYVFAGTGTAAYSENDSTGPTGVYGASKLEGEMLVMENNPDSVIIRTSWVYSFFGKNFVKTMLRLMKEKPSVGVVNDQIGSPTYAADLASAIIDIIRSGKFVPGIYHYSNEGKISWYDFAVAIKKIIHADCDVQPIPTSAYPTPAKRPLNSLMSKEKIKEVYSVDILPWKDSLEKCIRKLQAQVG